MPRLKLAYSGVALNRAALSGWRAFPGSGVLSGSRSTMLVHQGLSGKLRISEALANAFPHPVNEPLKVVHVPIVEAKRLFIKIAFQVVRRPKCKCRQGCV